MKQKDKNRKKGFTLIELIVAIAIFIVVISVVLSLFVTGLKGYRKVIAIQNVQDNARHLLEFISKEIRMSEINSATSTTLNITRPNGENVIYFFTTETVDGKTLGRINREDSSTSGPINSEEISVIGNFYIMGIGSDNQQPRVTIVIKVETVGKPEEKSEINIQTSLSPRDLES